MFRPDPQLASGACRARTRTRYAIACTNILRTIIDLGAVDPSGVHAAVGHAITTRLASLGAVEAAVGEHARPGRGGIVAVRHAVADWSSSIP